MRYEFSIDESFAQFINDQFVSSQGPCPRQPTQLEYGHFPSSKTLCPQPDPPQQMSSDFDLLLESLTALASAISLVLSAIIIYQHVTDEYVVLIGISLWTGLMIAVSIREIFKGDARIGLLELLISIPHPNVLTFEANEYLHLWMVLRLAFIFRYLLKRYGVYGARCSRVLNMYGVNAQSLLFCLKSGVSASSMSTLGILYLICLLVNTHMLYIVQSTVIPNPTFLQALSSVCTTFTTVGYGDFPIHSTLQRLVLSLSICNGVLSNSFIILTSLKTFHFHSSEENSHNLLRSLIMKEKLRETSSLMISEARKRADGSHWEEIRRRWRKEQRLWRDNKGDRVGLVENMSKSFRIGLDKLKNGACILGMMVNTLLKGIQRTNIQKQIRRQSKRKQRQSKRNNRQSKIKGPKKVDKVPRLNLVEKPAKRPNTFPQS